MGILSKFFGNSNSFKVGDLRDIDAAVNLMNPLQSYDPKRDIKLKNIIRYPTLAIGAGKIFNILRRGDNKKELRIAIEDGDISEENCNYLKRMCESFTRKIERIEGEIESMKISQIEGIRVQAASVEAGFLKLKEIIPRLAEILSEG